MARPVVETDAEPSSPWRFVRQVTVRVSGASRSSVTDAASVMVSLTSKSVPAAGLVMVTTGAVFEDPAASPPPASVPDASPDASTQIPSTHARPGSQVPAAVQSPPAAPTGTSVACPLQAAATVNHANTKTTRMAARAHTRRTFAWDVTFISPPHHL